MIHFNQIANPPMPTYTPICGVCEGRGVVPDMATKGVHKCTECNGSGKQTTLQSVEQEIKRLNAQSYEPTSADILAAMQMLIDALKNNQTP